MKEEKEPTEYVTIDELEKRGQVIHHPGPPGNIIKPCYCGKCGGHYTCTSDYNNHNCIPKSTSKGKLTPTDLDKLPWKTFRKGTGEWIFSNQATYLLEAIINGNTTFGNYHYWTYGDNRFIARRKIR